MIGRGIFNFAAISPTIGQSVQIANIGYTVETLAAEWTCLFLCDDHFFASLTSFARSFTASDGPHSRCALICRLGLSPQRIFLQCVSR